MIDYLLAAFFPSRRRKLIQKEFIAGVKSNPSSLIAACRSANMTSIGYDYLGRYPVRLDPSGKSITEGVIQSSSFQFELFENFARLVDIEGLRFVNVGANIGTSCLNAHAVGFREFIAFEPVSRNFAFLKENFSPSDSQFSLRQLAAGDAPGRAVINLHPSSGGRHSLVKSFGTQTEEIEIVRLDDVLDPKPSVLWIDTEGFEYRVLLGSSNFLKSSVKAICLEVTPELLGDDLGKLINLLTDVFSQFYTSEGERLEASRLFEHLSNGQHDLIALI